MNRSIILLNLALLAVLVAGGFEMRRRWVEAREREAMLLAVRPISPLLATPATTPVASPPPKLQSSQYIELAEKFLFARDRNPNIVIEKLPEPPPKKMPNFPGVYGVMDLGMGPTVFISPDGGQQQGYKLGDKIGEFTLLAANQKEITFEWEGKPLTRSMDELRPRIQDSASQAPAERMNSNVNSNAFAAPAPALQRPPENVRPAPGPDIGGGRKGCLPGDSSPAGTVADGHKKVSYSYAFGPICYWESSR